MPSGSAQSVGHNQRWKDETAAACSFVDYVKSHSTLFYVVYLLTFQIYIEMGFISWAVEKTMETHLCR